MKIMDRPFRFGIVMEILPVSGRQIARRVTRECTANPAIPVKEA
jgi:hypothetical protein